MAGTMDIEAMGREAVERHRQGDIAGAEALYQQVLRATPNVFGPYFYLGAIRLQQHRFQEAVDLLAKAVKFKPTDIGALMNYGGALRGIGRPQEALKCFDTVLRLQPDLVDAHYNRGVAQADLQRFELALDSYDHALALQPNYMPALINRGAALNALSRLEDALIAFDAVLAIDPANVTTWVNRGITLRSLGRAQAALTAFNQALAIQPNRDDAVYFRGVTLMSLGRSAEALIDFDAMLALRPSDPELLNNRGVALTNLGRPEDALMSLEHAVAVHPRFETAWVNRGQALRDLLRSAEALASFETALKLAPRNPVTWNMRGNSLRDLERHDEAIESYSRALKAAPDFAIALNNRGHTWWVDKGQYAPARADWQRALALDPAHPYAQGEMLHLEMYAAEWSGFENHKARIDAGVRKGERLVRPFVYQGISDSPQDLQACARIFAADKYRAMGEAPAPRKGAQKIRIGYLSGEFREQATAILMAGLYERHDRDKFEIVALDNGRDDKSAMRQRLEKAFDRRVDISEMSDAAAANHIRESEIDILVNLNGYFGHSRMGIFARRPAPLQVNYLGFPGTLGAPYMDYIIADRVVIPQSDEPFYDEKVVALPGSYQVNDIHGRAMADIPSRVETGLPQTGIVFCNFNNAYKLTPDTFAGWMRILQQVEGSVLWVLEGRPPFGENLRRHAQAAGVDPARILFAQDLPPDEHLARLSLADIFLDSLPYNAHTTGSDALWACVPVVTRRGSVFAGRVGASLLTAAGMPELVTQTQDAYEALAVKLARDPQALKAVKAKLAANRDNCELFNTDLFRSRIETAYTKMWERAQAGLPPESFSV